ncbi:DNA polymerase Y family protein [Streptomyces sp. NPDC001340]
MGRHILQLRFVIPADPDADLPERLRRLLQDITPSVQMIEPDMAVLDLTGALSYWQRDARGLAELVQLRVLAQYRSSQLCGSRAQRDARRHGLRPRPARSAYRHRRLPRGNHRLPAPRPVRELPGVGTRTAATLAEYGLHTVGDVADVPQLTLQRLLGARAGRTLHERAQGRDTQLVDPTPTPASISTEHRFPQDELDPAAHRSALLALADDLGARLRASGQIATGVTCTIRYADTSATRRSRTLPEATQHTVLLARAAYTVYDSLGLQRARVRGIALRADALRPADQATRQLTLDAGDDKPLAIEAAADRARARYGHHVLYPAVLAISSRPSSARHWERGGHPEDARGRRAT